MLNLSAICISRKFFHPFGPHFFFLDISMHSGMERRKKRPPPQTGIGRISRFFHRFFRRAEFSSAPAHDPSTLVDVTVSESCRPFARQRSAGQPGRSSPDGHREMRDKRGDPRSGKFIGRTPNMPSRRKSWKRRNATEMPTEISPGLMRITSFV